jgi:hypothetical protein
MGMGEKKLASAAARLMISLSSSSNSPRRTLGVAASSARGSEDCSNRYG